MTFDAKNIAEIYAGKVARKYDFSMAPFFAGYKKAAFSDSSLKSGDRVLVFCCGTGMDFPHILQKIGAGGEIVGVDFSSEMLNHAKVKIKQNQWGNIALIQADVTTFKDPADKKFDGGVCTLGMSIIPEFKSAYYNLISNVRKQGDIIIGDMQLASGRLALFNPLTIFLAKKFGGTHQGHQNSVELCALMKEELSDFRKKEFFLGAYFYCIGKTR